MKKLISVLFTGIFMISSSFAISLSVGGRGIVSTNVGSSSEIKEINLDSDFGVGGGIFANFTVLGGLGAQVEANFATSKLNLGSSVSETSAVSYESFLLDVPVMLWLNLDIWKLTVGLGGGVNFSTELNNSSSFVNQLSDSIKSENAFKLGAVFGLDAKFWLTDHLGIVANARYVMDFNTKKVPVTNIVPDSPEVTTVEFTRRALYGGIGIELKIFDIL